MAGSVQDYRTYTTVTGLPRAPRFAMRMLLLYRPVGESRWREGKTETISRSGVLFLAPERLRVNTPVELSFVLPVKTVRKAGANIICRGYIARVEKPAEAQAGPALAVKITGYSFIRGQDGFRK